MAKILPFRALRPVKSAAAKVAALPYDVFNKAEARIEVEKEPLSFLSIDRPETAFPEEQDMYASCVYEKANELLENAEQEGILSQDEAPYYYIYELTMNGSVQTGLVACSSVDDYINQVIKKHENTLEAKEQDRIRHVDTTSAQTGPIFLAYRSVPEISKLLKKLKEAEPETSFVSEDGIGHKVWVIRDIETISELTALFSKVPNTYIADGHHRAASAVKVSLKRRAEHPDADGTEEFNYFLSVLFAEDELHIMDYNRVLKGYAGFEKAGLLDRLSECFDIAKAPQSPYRPEAKGQFGMYLDGAWYQLTVKPELCKTDPVGILDVSYLQREVLEPIWGIEDPRTVKRIGFVGGIKGLDALEELCREEYSVAFSMYPTSMEELFAVADADLLMPPKSTWFEPKLRSGLFIHKIER